MARRRLQKIEHQSSSQLPLLDFIPAVSRRFTRPRHLEPFADRLEAAAAQETRLCVHVPPRHGKTQLLLHHIVRSLLRDPARQFGYGSYSADIAISKSRLALDIARSAGLELVTEKAEEWRTPQGGGLVARGVGGGWTGRGLDELAIDDPIKDRAEAESPTHRARLWDWFNDTAYNRLEPNGSIIVNHTRWHPDDLIGRLLREDDSRWEYLRLPALCDSEDDPLGRELDDPLWPERWPPDQLADRMRNEYTKASLYQGRPRPRGVSVFQDVVYYTELPTNGIRYGIGIDLAYTEKTQSDWSVAVVVAKAGEITYVVKVLRAQVTAPVFRDRLKAIQGEYRVPARIYFGGGGEKGVVDLMREGGLRIDAVQATADKFVRAQPASEGWNAGRVQLPISAPWLNDFVDEVCSFSGVKDLSDDQVDALAAAYDSVNAGPTVSNVKPPWQ